jgi:hypothetical protein
LVKEDVAVSAIGLRVALICAVLSAVAYECLTMLVYGMRFYYHSGLQKKNEIQGDQVHQRDYEEIYLLKKQISKLTEKNKEYMQHITERNEEQSKKIQDIEDLLHEERVKNQLLISTSNIKMEDNMI